jgi:hypothetical protein
MECNAALDRVSAEWFAGACWKQLRGRVDVTLGEPRAQHVDDRDCQWRDAILSTLAVTGKMRTSAEVNVALPQTDQLGNPQSGLNRDQ